MPVFIYRHERRPLPAFLSSWDESVFARLCVYSSPAVCWSRRSRWCLPGLAFEGQKSFWEKSGLSKGWETYRCSSVVRVRSMRGRTVWQRSGTAVFLQHGWSWISVREGPMRFCVLGRLCLKVCCYSDSICCLAMKNEGKTAVQFALIFCKTEHVLGNNVVELS